jgi:hypothetical protein
MEVWAHFCVRAILARLTRLDVPTSSRSVISRVFYHGVLLSGRRSFFKQKAAMVEKRMVWSLRGAPV